MLVGVAKSTVTALGAKVCSRGLQSSLMETKKSKHTTPRTMMDVGQTVVHRRSTQESQKLPLGSAEGKGLALSTEGFSRQEPLPGPASLRQKPHRQCGLDGADPAF
uniref:Uncharacterized protein n=1 Tax=Eutreptiella gymnastica TaxID=73025 RepID=A0A7S1ICR9_9EUGL|mmetsp:Transcript_147512/g.257927  ORF Transcript_147512/g.257927 Transcript_147512/m.257927 type:complete len:106 (+) Transcript_147512:751-1068(+)